MQYPSNLVKIKTGVESSLHFAGFDLNQLFIFQHIDIYEDILLIFSYSDFIYDFFSASACPSHKGFRA